MMASITDCPEWARTIGAGVWRVKVIPRGWLGDRRPASAEVTDDRFANHPAFSTSPAYDPRAEKMPTLAVRVRGPAKLIAVSSGAPVFGGWAVY